MMDIGEIELVQRAQQGDTMAFDSLVRLYDRRVLQIAFTMLGSLQDAQDAYQDAFFQAFRKIALFKSESSFGTWLIRIVINNCINRIRTKQRLKWLYRADKSGDNAALWPENLETTEQGPESDLLSMELRQQIRQGLAALSGQQRAVFMLKHEHGYKIVEIARILDCSAGTVKNQLFRATQKLRKKLLKYVF